MTDIFAKLGLPPDISTRELANNLECGGCPILDLADTCPIKLTVSCIDCVTAVLEALERRAEQRVWEKMRWPYRWRLNFEDLPWDGCWKQGAEACRFTTCPQLKGDEDE